MKCPKCSFENLADAQFCQNCGEQLERACPSCGTYNAPTARFCRICGFSFLGKSSPVATYSLSTLLRLAPPDLQEKIRAARSSAEGERKLVTILFTELVSTPSLSEKLDPKAQKEIVSSSHRIISEAVYRYEGTVAQVLGNGLFAFFGAPVSHEDDAIRAVHAAFDIQHSIGDYARSLDGGVDNFQICTGLNTGTVVVGNIGSDLYMDYLALGDSVNLAARLQSAAQPGTVLLGEDTARLVTEVFQLKPFGEIWGKNKTEPVKVFQVSETKAAPQTECRVEKITSPLVGRESEMQRLKESLDALSEGHGQVVAVIGDAGIGKSRLVEEARRRGDTTREPQTEATVGSGTGKPNSITASRTASTSPPRWLEGRALSYGQTLPFRAFDQLLKADLGLSDADPEPKIRVALRRRMSSLSGERASDLLPFLSYLLGIKLEGVSAERVRALDGDGLNRQVIGAVADYFGRLAREMPTVLLFEDLQWADPSTLQTLEQLLPLTSHVPLMLLLVSRIEPGHESWRTTVKAETDSTYPYLEINLKPLSADDSNRLINNLLEGTDLPQSIRRLILELAEGNPFYLEEIIRSLIEQGALVHEGQTWRTTGQIASLARADSLEEVMRVRIDHLEEDERRTLQLASETGKSFLFRLLEKIAETEKEVDTHLARLQHAEFGSQPPRRPELEDVFKPAHDQEPAFDSLPIDKRREFHRRVGQTLEKIFAEMERPAPRSVGKSL